MILSDIKQQETPLKCHSNSNCLSIIAQSNLYFCYHDHMYDQSKPYVLLMSATLACRRGRLPFQNIIKGLFKDSFNELQAHEVLTQWGRGGISFCAWMIFLSSILLKTIYRFLHNNKQAHDQYINIRIQHFQMLNTRKHIFLIIVMYFKNVMTQFFLTNDFTLQWNFPDCMHGNCSHFKAINVLCVL